MAYTPKTWVCGEPITDVGLNNMEEGIQEALRGGYECTETIVVGFDGSITTVEDSGVASGQFTPSQPISGDSIIVTMNGTEYELPKFEFAGQIFYGEFNDEGPDFTTYPCIVVAAGMFATENPGTYTVKIESDNSEITTTDCFKKAVNKVVRFPLTRFIDGPVDGSVQHVYAIEASGQYAFAEGYYSHATGKSAHTEGQNTEASGEASHAEGTSTVASGEASHAEGNGTTASGDKSHAQNENTIARGRAQTAIGKYNVAQGTNGSIATTDYAFIIGNGTSANNRSNAFAIKWDGTFVFADGTEITPAQFAALKALLS